MNNKLLYKIIFVEIILCILIVECRFNKEVEVKEATSVTVNTTDIDNKLDSFTGVIELYSDSIKQLDYGKDTTIKSIEMDTSNISIYNRFKSLLYELK